MKKYSLHYLFEDMRDTGLARLLLEATGGMAGQDAVAAYLIRATKNLTKGKVVRCTTARPGTHDPDVVGYDDKDAAIIQVEVKDITGGGKYDGYAEVNVGKVAFRKDIGYENPKVDGATFPKKFGNIKGAPDLQTLNPKLEKASKAMAGTSFSYCVMYGGPAHKDTVYSAGSYDEIIKGCWGGTELTMDQILAVQGSEQLQLFRGKYGMIHGMIVAVTNKAQKVQLMKLYAPGKHLGGNERPYDNLARDWAMANYGDTFVEGDNGLEAKGRGQGKAKDKHALMMNGKFSDTKIRVTVTPASWIPVPAQGGKTFNDTMHDYYKKGKDNYYAGTRGENASLYWIFGGDYLKAGATEFTPVNSKGEDLSKKAPGERVDAPGFQGQDYAAVYFKCKGGISGKAETGEVAKLKEKGEIVQQS